MPVTLPGRARLATNPLATGSLSRSIPTTGVALVAFLATSMTKRAGGHDDVDLDGDEPRDHRAILGPVAPNGTAFDHEVLPRDPAQLAQALEERIVVDVGGNGDADPRGLALLLRFRDERRGEQEKQPGKDASSSH